ncbi:Lrp/AsnC family transcriptional regulator [Actinomycetospora termitidis]|uniref:AsnC family transcriptional regulator n=1 Tax=Actinomycetospora termitidis TaxID=3053470 RepID=A0ABT7M9A2_9PSEU|nr:AsnC family transcriptional regulator [Actinomycetospora sp. Odt1-22]MDL5157251.1 AsnC family transcriptional regulator [Actinomycetospora sp. Odt1-22]
MELDVLDRALIQALQIDGRAPFRRVAEVLGVSDQTVARRYARLRSAQALRVIGASDPAVVGEDQWMVRARCTPDAASEVADALARRPDTSWVSLTSGGTEVLCSWRASEADGDLLLGRLPRTPRVLDVSAHQVLHVFYGGAREPYTKVGPLTSDQIGALTAASPPADRTPVLDEIDRRMLRLLRVDGRAPVEDMARACGTSASTVRRRLADLRAAGVLYLDVDVAPAVHDQPLRTMLYLAVLPDRLDEVGRALAAHPEVPFAAATTGRTTVYASVATTGPAAFYRYLTTSVAALPGVTAVESAPVIRTVKAADTVYAAR